MEIEEANSDNQDEDVVDSNQIDVESLKLFPLFDGDFLTQNTSNLILVLFF